MSYRVVGPEELMHALRRVLDGRTAGCVTGPGRSGAIASAFASHILSVPFIPFRQQVPDKLRPVLIVDTATWTGAAARKAARLYGPGTEFVVAFNEPPMVKFWYERSVQ